MKKLFIVLSLLLIFSPVIAQQQIENAFIGTWQVVNAQVIPELASDMAVLDAEGKKKMEHLSQGFVGAVLTFRNNKQFSMKLGENTPDFMKAFSSLNDKKWKLENGQVINIGNEVEGYNLMKLYMVSREGKQYFIIEESPFMLEVKKL